MLVYNTNGNKMDISSSTVYLALLKHLEVQRNWYCSLVFTSPGPLTQDANFFLTKKIFVGQSLNFEDLIPHFFGLNFAFYSAFLKWKGRASINFQTQEVPDFLPLKFGSPTGKSRKSHFFSVLRRSALSLVEHRFLFQCHTESS